MKTTLLFDQPQTEIASMLVGCLKRATSVSIVAGFATEKGMATISGPLLSRPHVLQSLVIGAATYSGLSALDTLLSHGVPADRLRIHLGQTRRTRGRKHPFARFRPMLHSKIYYMELGGDESCALVGSHNITEFALSGLNGEASILLEGPRSSAEFTSVRNHIAAAVRQSARYDPSKREAYAWWTRDYLDGLAGEVGLPRDGENVRTLLLFVEASGTLKPAIGDEIYFEIPAGIQQIESLKTEVHLFLFDSLPADPEEALRLAPSARAAYSCLTRGVDNSQGNRSLLADWYVDTSRGAVLRRVAGGTHAPTPSPGKQQVRAEVIKPGVAQWEYLFSRSGVGWEPVFRAEEPRSETETSLSVVREESRTYGRFEPQLVDVSHDWRLVDTLIPADRERGQRDQFALELASPASGAFVLVSVRRRAGAAR